MAKRSHVPKFGNWESENDIPYTAYFEKASKSRNGAKMINPNDPKEKAFFDDKPPVRTAATKNRPENGASVITGAARSNQERQSRKGDDNHKRSTDSSARNDNVIQKTGTDSPLQYNGDSRKTGQQNGGSSTDQSPIHPHQVRVSGKGRGVSTPSSERKGSSEHNLGLGSSTPGRSRQRPSTRADETRDRGAAVPKFGAWNEDPGSAGGYTQAFNKVREEKQGGSQRGRVTPAESSHNGHQQNNNDDSKAVCCFAWGRK